MGSSRLVWFSSLAILLSSSFFIAHSTKVSRDSRAILIDGQRRLLLSGSIHYPRSTPEMWPDLIQKAKEGGLDAIETYVFWNAHEPRRREYNFEGNLNLVKFIKEIQNAGLYAVLRIGPYVCAEWNYGGIPVWLREISGMQFRTNNQPFKDEMRNFVTYIVNLLKNEKLLAPQGGPIILTQIENEYGNIENNFGNPGKEYVQWCANMAESFDVGVPWIMCQQADAPQPMINTCNGFYCNEFNTNNESNPKMWTENWSGWFKGWGLPDEHRPAEDLAYSVARFFQSNGTFQNYYMYHGGTNFGRTTGGPYISTSYDYDAPLDEYGNIRQPKWGHLRDLHTTLKSMEKALLYGDVMWRDLDNGLSLTRFYGDHILNACFLTNKNQTVDAIVEYEGSKFFLPAWSMSFLPDCKNEVYNTAKVTAQTTIMTYKPNQAEQEPEKLKWSWSFENLNQSLQGLGASFTNNNLLEQIVTSVDASDYLWYMTSVDSSVGDDQRILYVNTTGHVLSAFVNGVLVGSQYSIRGDDQNLHPFEFQRNITLSKGRNNISLLSATVGLQNYGAFYELVPAGIVGGPVKLIGSNDTIDLSHNPWAYKVGLDGLTNVDQSSSSFSWLSGDKPLTYKPFTWYKTTFQAPLGHEPVVVDLLGMGKGEAWVNGNSIGRFWPSYNASMPKSGCNICDYRGEFNAGKCVTRCGESSQRWYHVPRSFLKASEPNTLTLFEEAGGDPSHVNFQTVVVGKICGSIEEDKTLSLSCQGYGRTIKSIDFASFGDPQGTCGSFTKGKCESEDAFYVIQNACLGKESCMIEATDDFLGCPNCDNYDSAYKLVVQATCSGA